MGQAHAQLLRYRQHCKWLRENVFLCRSPHIAFKSPWPLLRSKQRNAARPRYYAPCRCSARSVKRLGPAQQGSGDSDGDASGCSGRGAASLVTAGQAEVAAALASALHQTLQELLELLPMDPAEGPARTQYRLAGLLLQMMLRLHIAAAGLCCDRCDPPIANAGDHISA